MPPVDWTPVELEGVQWIYGIDRATGDRAHGAQEAVDSLAFIVDLDQHEVPEPTPQVLGHELIVVDASFARWAVATAITALDLCAAVLGRQYSGVTGDANDMSVPSAIHLKHQKKHPYPADALAWLNELKDDDRYKMVREVRNRMIHQVQPRSTFFTTVDPVARASIRRDAEVVLPGAVIDTFTPVPNLIKVCFEVSREHVGKFLSNPPLRSLAPTRPPPPPPRRKRSK